MLAKNLNKIEFMKQMAYVRWIVGLVTITRLTIFSYKLTVKSRVNKRIAIDFFDLYIVFHVLLTAHRVIK